MVIDRYNAKARQTHRQNKNATYQFKGVITMIIEQVSLVAYGSYYKNKLELKSNSNKIFCQLIASLSEFLFRLKLTKLKLEILKSDF